MSQSRQGGILGGFFVTKGTDVKNEMNIQWMDIDEIKPYERNPRLNNLAVDKVADSLKEYGWKQPIVVDKNNVIIAGHTRYKAAKQLGIDKVPVIIAKDLTQKQVRGYRIADNKTSDFSIWDNKLLLDELEDLEDVFTGFEGFSIDAQVLNEKETSLLNEDDFDTMYEVVFRSKSSDKIEKIKIMWEELDEESDINS